MSPPWAAPKKTANRNSLTNIFLLIAPCVSPVSDVEETTNWIAPCVSLVGCAEENDKQEHSQTNLPFDYLGVVAAGDDEQEPHISSSTWFPSQTLGEGKRTVLDEPLLRLPGAPSVHHDEQEPYK